MQDTKGSNVVLLSSNAQVHRGCVSGEVSWVCNLGAVLVKLD